MSRNPLSAISPGSEKTLRRTFAVHAADGLPIEVRDHGGEGPLLLFIHGWSCNQDFWAPQIEPLSLRFRVVTIDLPGHGEANAKRGDRRWSIEAFGADVAAVVDALGASDVGLVGHSMGGAVAVEAALALGPKCRFMLGVDTFNEAAFYGRRPDGEIRERCAAFGDDFAGTMRGMVGAITDPSVDPAVVAWIGDAMASSRPPVALAVLEALLAWDIEARWGELAVPAATINSAMLAARNELLDLPGLDVRLIGNTGHFPMLETPEAFNALALGLLEGRFS
ncbi:alpha/beta hydrolase [Kaistia algarum]|uniref:alpha/beta fold hydrolase n=1 Tax=Kaistia algarum TaxID=2083279 RepID=UPI000CE8991D|nr:alpha/beta hydrolase [Kaistia algarum]MCX5515454.1 alpha/beta hydrolase [Kaistia algarum]PPE78487.1 alpha/beta hydrolase [Kaistia algarum]